jgi:hypothetical protein
LDLGRRKVVERHLVVARDAHLSETEGEGTHRSIPTHQDRRRWILWNAGLVGADLVAVREASQKTVKVLHHVVDLLATELRAEVTGVDQNVAICRGHRCGRSLSVKPCRTLRPKGGLTWNPVSQVPMQPVGVRDGNHPQTLSAALS